MDPPAAMDPIPFRRRSVPSLKRQAIDAIGAQCTRVFSILPRSFESGRPEGELESKIQRAIRGIRLHLLLGLPASLAEELVPVVLSSIEVASRKFSASPCDPQSELNDCLYVTLRMTEIVALDCVRQLNLKVGPTDDANGE